MRRYKLRTNILIVIVLCLTAFVFSECKKYPDGPKISFRSRATRITATWYIDLYLLNGTDQTTTYLSSVGDTYALTIEKNGTYQKSGNFPDEGTCRFGDKHENIYLQSYSASKQEQKYSILRLEFKSLWLKSIKPNGDEEEIHYITYR